MTNQQTGVGKCPNCNLSIILPASGPELRQPDIEPREIICSRCGVRLLLEPVKDYVTNWIEIHATVIVGLTGGEARTS